MHHGLQVHHIKNITDVGHMRQELVETGGDKMILAALPRVRLSRKSPSSMRAASTETKPG